MGKECAKKCFFEPPVLSTAHSVDFGIELPYQQCFDWSSSQLLRHVLTFRNLTTCKRFLNEELKDGKPGLEVV